MFGDEADYFWLARHPRGKRYVRLFLSLFPLKASCLVRHMTLGKGLTRVESKRPVASGQRRLVQAGEWPLQHRGLLRIARHSPTGKILAKLRCSRLVRSFFRPAALNRNLVRMQYPAVAFIYARYFSRVSQ
jgi:hypothetical protein